MDTPITLSSTSTLPNKSDFLQLNYTSGKNNDSVVSIDSSFERVPVSWGSSNAFARSNSNTSLTNIQKVSNWIKSIEGDDEPKNDSIIVDIDNDIADCDTSFTKPTSVKSMDSPQKDLGTDSKSVILFRCDFNKSVTAKTYYPPLNPFNRSTPLINYFRNENDSKITSTVDKISNSMDKTTKKDNLKNPTNKKVIQKRLLLKRPVSNKLINYPSQIDSKFSIESESYCLKGNDEKSDGSSDLYEVPLSSESHKKELWSYLQLMNPADKKERFILQNRRSTRVKNLAAMQEKKEMERKIKKSEDTDLSEKEVEKCPTLKSFKELNIRVEKTQIDSSLSEEKTLDADFEKDIFCFPFPSKDFTEKVDDFDNVMSKLVATFKRTCILKNLQLYTKGVVLRTCAPRNKENLIKSIVKTKCNEMKLSRNVKGIKINNVKSNITKKGHRLKEMLKKKKYKKSLTSERRISLRGAGKLNNIASKKLRGKKEIEIKMRKNLTKKPLWELQKADKAKKGRPKKKSSAISSRRASKSKSTSSQCEIVTVTENNEEDHIDLENFMDDMIDFNNLSEEHKKCLIESRILSTKPVTRVASTNSAQENGSNSFYSLQAISPLYGFDKSDVSEVKRICEAYKNSTLLKNFTAESIPESFLNEKMVKVEEPELIDDEEYKTEGISAESPVEKLVPPIIADKIEHEFIILNNASINIENPPVQNPDDGSEINTTLPNGNSLQEHDYAGLPNGEEENEDKEIDVVTVPNKNLPVAGYIEINPRQIEKKSKFELLPYNKSVEMKSLHRSLQYLKRKNHNTLADHTFARDWELDSQKQKSKKQSHYISINKENGIVLKAFYIDYNLVVCQEYVVSFWMQTPLGNVLGSQNMWIPRGQTQRLVLNSKCIQKESMEMVIAMETHVAYIELWTKEHKSDIREGPVADVFATVYFWKQRQNGLEKKVLQLENINGFADDVQYSVMKCSPKIIVSWHSANEDDTLAKRTFIHAYQLAPDYQTVSNIYDIEPVDHYVSSLHNIEDCDNLIMGCGENKITLWNVEYGYIVATIELTEIKSPLSTLWVKCDRGFLFALQQCVDRELRLIAINGINHSWKKLASYNPPEGFDRLRGVCIDNGLLLSFYDQGILCWKAETGEPVEETNLETEIIPSGKYVILMEGNQILVKHAITHLMSMSVDET